EEKALRVAAFLMSYYGTDNLYLNYLTNFVKPGGLIGIAGAGLVNEFEIVPDHLQAMWSEDFWCLHSADWWLRHWGRTGIIDVQTADQMKDGWKVWLEWQQTAHPDNSLEIETVAADKGDNLGYVRTVGRRRDDAAFVDYCWRTRCDRSRSTTPNWRLNGETPYSISAVTDFRPTVFRSTSSPSSPNMIVSDFAGQ
ncbi:MAG: hypothetical protein ABGZ24_27780, partial [Fuerstiella sp.]